MSGSLYGLPLYVCGLFSYLFGYLRSFRLRLAFEHTLLFAPVSFISNSQNKVEHPLGRPKVVRSFRTKSVCICLYSINANGQFERVNSLAARRRYIILPICVSRDDLGARDYRTVNVIDRADQDCLGPISLCDVRRL